MEILESNLSLQPDDLLNGDARIMAKLFMANNVELKITSREFETMLLKLAATTLDERQSVPNVVPSWIDGNEALSKKPNQRWPARLSVAPTDRRSISLGEFPSMKKSFLEKPNDSFLVSRREKLIHEHENLLRHYEEATLFLDDQRTGMQAKLSIYETQLQELLDNDHKRLHDIEAIEQELEATQNELHERRIKQTEELQKAKEAAAIFEAELAKNCVLNSREIEAGDLESTLNMFDTTQDSADYPYSGDINIRLHRLEEEKRTYQDVIAVLKKERTGLLTMVEHLKKQLNDLQSKVLPVQACNSKKNLLDHKHYHSSDVCESKSPVYIRIGFITGAIGLCLAGAAVFSIPSEEGTSRFANCEQTLKYMVTSFQGWFQDQDL